MIVGKSILSKVVNRTLFASATSQVRCAFSVWKSPVNLETEKTLFPSPKDLFPKANENAYTTLNDLTPSLLKSFQGLQEDSVQRAAYMQFAKPNGNIYHIFDASKIPLGRLCQKAAFYLQGKHRPTFRNCDQEIKDHIIIVNAQNVLLTGKKALLKTIKYHTGFVGGLKEKSYSFFLTQKPEQLVFYCLSKMLPKNLKRRHLLQKVQIFRDFQHDRKGLPNFIPYTKKADHSASFNPFVHDMENLVIKYHSAKELPKELQGIKVEKDPEIEIPFNQRAKIFKMNVHNIRVMKQWKIFYKRQRRYKVHTIKAPKNRDPNLSKTSFMITSDRQIKDYNLMHRIVPEEVPEEDDEIMRVIPRRGGAPPPPQAAGAPGAAKGGAQAKPAAKQGKK